MTNRHRLVIGALGIALLSPTVHGQALSRYRTFDMGSSVAAVLTATHAVAAEVKTIHTRPALMQDLTWRPSRWVPGSMVASTDPVDQMLFSFYDDQLFRIVIDYGRDRTAGMTDADMIDAISSTYGLPLQPTRTVIVGVAARLDADRGTVIARWGNADSAVVLYRTSSYGNAMQLIVTKTALDALATQAEAQAATLDVVEAPQRELARQKKAEDERLAADEKARAVNRPVFKP